MAVLPKEFMWKVARALEEEEEDIYSLTLFCLSTDDLLYFREKDRERVKRIFKILIEGTRHHAELLKLIVEMGSR